MPTHNKQKILYIITKSNFGGAQKYVFDLALASKQAGYDVVVACGGTGEASASTGLLVQKLESNNIPAIHIKNFLRDMSFFNDIKAFVEIYKILKKQKPDILHVTSSKAGGIGALAGRLSRIKRIIFTSHGLTIDETWRPRWQRILIYLGTWLTLRLAHHNIMINSETTNRAKSMPSLSKRVSLVKNGIAEIEFVEKAEARAKLAPQLDPNQFWIGGMGELHPNKNWQSAIRAMTNLPKETHLLIIGEGEERPKLENTISSLHLPDRVHLLGFVEGAKYLKAFDVFILPSLKEGLPYVLLEAGQAGLPIVASNLLGNIDIITNGKDGLLINPEPVIISATLNKLLADKKLRDNLSLSIKNRITKDFSIKVMFEQTLAIYSTNKSDV